MRLTNETSNIGKLTEMDSIYSSDVAAKGLQDERRHRVANISDERLSISCSVSNRTIAYNTHPYVTFSRVSGYRDSMALRVLHGWR